VCNPEAKSLSAPAPVFTAPQRTEWRLVWLLVATSLSLALHIGKVPPSLPALRSDFGLSLSAAGWLVSIVNLTGAAGALLLALGADRLGFARLIGIGAGLAAVGSALAASFANVPLLLVCRFFEGMGFILVSVSVPSLMLRIASPRDLRLVLSLWSAFVPAGAGSMMIIAAALPGHGAWRLLWYGAAMASAAASVAIFLATRRAPALTRSEMAAPLRWRVSARSSPHPACCCSDSVSPSMPAHGTRSSASCRSFRRTSSDFPCRAPRSSPPSSW